MPEPVDLAHAFGLQPAEVVDYFKSKGFTFSHHWWEVWQSANAASFTVAKAARMDVLGAIKTEVDNIFVEGITGREFRKRLEPRLREMGWWGRAIDDLGNEIQLGSPKRLRTIYNTNLRTGYARGRYARQIEAVQERPYWMYDAVNDGRTRPSHRAMDGKVFRWDDPIWKTLYPPNGFNCRCAVRGLTAEQVRARGLTIESSKGRLFTQRQVVGVDKTNNIEIETTGTGYRWRDENDKPRKLLPDPGWSYNPGEGRGARPMPLVPPPPPPRPPGRPLPADLKPASTWPRRGRPELLPPGDGSMEDARRRIAEALGIPEGGNRWVETPAGLEDVVIDWGGIKHYAKQGREQYANYILPTLRDPEEVWLGPWQRRSKGGLLVRTEYRRRFFRLFDDPDESAVLAVTDEMSDGSLLLTVFPAESLEYVDWVRAGAGDRVYLRESAGGG